MPELSDTTPQSRRVLIRLMRQAPPWRKLELMSQLNAMAQTLVLSDIRESYPNATPAEERRHLADRLLGYELAKKIYGPWEKA